MLNKPLKIVDRGEQCAAANENCEVECLCSRALHRISSGEREKPN